MNSMGTRGSSSLPFVMKRWSIILWAIIMRFWLHSLPCYFYLLLWRFLCNFIKHFQMFFAFFGHLFLGFKIYTPMQSILNHSLFFLLCMIPYFYLCICFFHFSTLTMSPWSYLSFFISIRIWISTFVFFSTAFSCLFLFPFKHLFYFHLFLSPFLSLSLCTSLSSTLFPSISLFVPMSICLSQSLYFYLPMWLCLLQSLQLLIIHYLCVC
jgi:hypothetical protein